MTSFFCRLTTGFGLFHDAWRSMMAAISTATAPAHGSTGGLALYPPTQHAFGPRMRDRHGGSDCGLYYYADLAQPLAGVHRRSNVAVVSR